MTGNPTITVAFQGNKSASDYAALAALAERLSFDGVSVYADLMFQPAFFPLLIMAQHTSRVRLGPAALNPRLLHPVEIAGQIAALDHLSNGRAYLGLARGAWLDSLAIDDHDAVPRMRDAVAVITRLLAGKRDGYQGVHYQLAAGEAREYAVLRPAVPLLIGTWGPRMAALAGELAAEVKIGGSANPAMIPVMRRYLASGETRAGRPLGSVGIVLGAVTVVDEDGPSARALARREVARYLPVVAPLDHTVEVPPTLLSGLSAGADPCLIPDPILDRFAFAGTAAQLIRQVENLFAAGASRVEFGTPHGFTASSGLRLLGGRVLPAFRH
jgi:5,10-methylenetetrahydromethanopterin reductase